MPRLPQEEPELTPAKSGFFTKREKLIMGVAAALALVLTGLFLLLLIQAGRTPQQALDVYAGGELAVQEDIVMVSFPNDPQRSAYFYISGDKLACALLNRGMSGYKVEHAGGGLRLTGTETQGIWKMLGSDKKDFFVFGLLYDNAVKSVKVNGQKAVLVDNGMYRCWFYYAADAMSIDSESVVYQS